MVDPTALYFDIGPAVSAFIRGLQQNAQPQFEALVRKHGIVLP